MIARYYTPILSELDGSSSNTGYDYLVLSTEVVKALDANANAFKFNGLIKNINLTESANAKFPVLHLDDEDVVISYEGANGKNSYQFIIDYTADEILEKFTYAAEFCEEVIAEIKK